MAAAILGNDSNSNYEIKNLSQLETSSSNLANYEQRIANNSSSLKYILTAVENSWQNEAGADIQSILASLRNSIKILEEEIQPVISEYATILNQIVTDTRMNQSQSL